MDLSTIILGPVVTEKAEAGKTGNVYVIRVAPRATKIDVKRALKRFYDADVESIRVLNTVRKFKNLGTGTIMEKRHRSKRMIVRLSAKSKALDLSNLETS